MKEFFKTTNQSSILWAGISVILGKIYLFRKYPSIEDQTSCLSADSKKVSVEKYKDHSNKTCKDKK